MVNSHCECAASGSTSHTWSGLPLGVPVEHDAHRQIHQLPGRVTPNLKHQLSVTRMSDRLGEGLPQTVRARQDLGYPLLVTPFTQPVVSEAAIDVMEGETVRSGQRRGDQVALGFLGEEDSVKIDRNVRDRVPGQTLRVEAALECAENHSRPGASRPAALLRAAALVTAAG